MSRNTQITPGEQINLSNASPFSKNVLAGGSKVLNRPTDAKAHCRDILLPAHSALAKRPFSFSNLLGLQEGLTRQNSRRLVL